MGAFVGRVGRINKTRNVEQYLGARDTRKRGVDRKNIGEECGRMALLVVD